jgi:hypothetical protein
MVCVLGRSGCAKAGEAVAKSARAKEAGPKTDASTETDRAAEWTEGGAVARKIQAPM